MYVFIYLCAQRPCGAPRVAWRTWLFPFVMYSFQSNSVQQAWQQAPLPAQSRATPKAWLLLHPVGHNSSHGRPGASSAEAAAWSRAVVSMSSRHAAQVTLHPARHSEGRPRYHTPPWLQRWRRGLSKDSRCAHSVSRGTVTQASLQPSYFHEEVGL